MHRVAETESQFQEMGGTESQRESELRRRRETWRTTGDVQAVTSRSQIIIVR